MDLMNLDPMSKFMGLFVGPNGSGKSIAIASWKKKGSIYYFDFDGRMNSVANWYKKRGLKEGELFSDTYGPQNIYEAYTKLADFAASCPHAAIVLDSFTAITVSAVTFSIKRRSGKSGNQLPKTSKGDMIIPDWDEWNGEATYVTMLIDLCKQIAANGTAVFWTAHPVEKININPNDKSVSYQTKYAAFGHKSDSLLPIYFNEIYHFRIELGEDNQLHRLCYTQPEGSVVAAKTALNLPVKFDWTNQDFYDRLHEELKKGEENNEVTL